MDSAKYAKSTLKSEIEQAVRSCDSLRQSKDKPHDISFAAYVKARWNMSMEALYMDLGINPSMDTVQNLLTLPDFSARWLVPEIIREAIKLGLRKSPIWSDLIASEQSIKGLTITQPWINMSDAAPYYVGEGENIALGNISYDQKQVSVRKLGRGIRITYEVKDYVSLNVVALYLQDFGVKLGQAMDTLLIETLINGEQADGSESAPVIGVDTPGTLTYADFLRIWIRMGRLGKTPRAMIGGEQAANDTLNLPEFKTPVSGSPLLTMNVKTPIPKTSAYYVNGNVPANQQIIIDPSSAIIKYNAQPLLVESEKIIANQTEETFATLTTGFGILFRDSRIVVDETLDIDAAGFPSYMEVDSLDIVPIS